MTLWALCVGYEISANADVICLFSNAMKIMVSEADGLVWAPLHLDPFRGLHLRLPNGEID